MAGSKFYFLKNEGVMLELALTQFAFDKLIKKGFIPFSTPDLAKDKVLLGIVYNPRGQETQIYSVENTDLNLVGTAEITMGGYHMDGTIPEDKLPLKYVALSHCYRTEAGSYGRHSSGLYRVHQFTKIEMFAYTTPEASESDTYGNKSLHSPLPIPYSPFILHPSSLTPHLSPSSNPNTDLLRKHL